MKKLSLIFCLFIMVGCGSNHKSKEDKEGVTVEKVALNDDNLLSTDQYLTDDRSRMTILIQCEQYYANNTGDSLPPHCSRAKDAEKKAVLMDVIQAEEAEKGRSLSETEIQEISDSLTRH